MAITTSCPQCKSRFRLQDNLAGKTLRCQKCQQMFVVPLTDASGTEAVIATPVSAMPEPAPLPPTESLTPQAPVQPDQASEEIIEASLAELPVAEPVAETGSPAPKPQAEEAPKPASAAPPRHTPLAPEQPVSIRASITALAVFLVAMLGSGIFASYWLASIVSPPASAMIVPPLHVAEDNHPGDRRIPVGKDRPRTLEPTPLPLQADGKVFVQGRLEVHQPQIDHAQFGHDGPCCLYRVRLEQGKRYNFMVTSLQFTPRFRLYDGDNKVVEKQSVFFAADRRVIASYHANRTADYLIHLSAAEWVAGNFNLHLSPVTVGETFPIPLPAGLAFSIRHELRLKDPLDPGAPPSFGPYREYSVMLVAHQEYHFKATSATFPPMLRLYNHQGMVVSTRKNDLTYRAPVTGNFRLRVTSAAAGTGNYVLQVARREDFPVEKRLQTIIVRFEENDRYEDDRAFTDADPTEPKINRGPYKAYLVPLERGNTYIFDLNSKNILTRLSLFDPDGKHLSEGMANIRFKNANSRLVYPCMRDGLYRLHAVSVLPRKTGTYTLRITKQPEMGQNQPEP